mgnify:CR=1 FL=1
MAGAAACSLADAAAGAASSLLHLLGAGLLAPLLGLPHGVLVMSGAGLLVYVAAAMYLAARKYPFTPVWNRAVFGAVKAVVGIPVFAVGGIRTAREASEILARGDADMIGVGRPFYAEPDLARRFLAEAGLPLTTTTACESCNRCIVPQMLGMPGVCYNPGIHKLRKHGADPRPPAKRVA